MTAWPSLPSTATTVETIWTVASTVGLLVALLGVGITATNLRAARAAHRRACRAVPAVPLHTLLTWQAVRTEGLIVAVVGLLAVVLALFVGVGFLALDTPEPARPEVMREQLITTAVLVVGAVLFAVISTLLTVASHMNRRDRHRITNRITGRLLQEQIARRRGTEGHP